MVFVREVRISSPSQLAGKKWEEYKSLWVVDDQGVFVRRVSNLVELFWFRSEFLTLCGVGLLGLFFLSLMLAGMFSSKLNLSGEQLLLWGLVICLSWVVLLSMGRLIVRSIYKPYQGE